MKHNIDQSYQSKINEASIWSVDRIARLVVGISNTLALVASVLISPYFLIILGFINLNLVFTSLTDKCHFKNLLLRLGAKEREDFFHPNRELIKDNKSSYEPLNLNKLKKA